MTQEELIFSLYFSSKTPEWVAIKLQHSIVQNDYSDGFSCVNNVISYTKPEQD